MLLGSGPTMRELIKATLKTGSGAGGKLLLGMIAVKIMAVMLGPSGIGLYSLLRQTTAFSEGAGTMGGGVALVQGLASREGKAQANYLATTFWIFVLGATLAIILLFVLAPWISLWIFDRSDGQTITLIRWLAVPVALGVASTYLLGVHNGFRAIGTLALLKVLGSAAMALLAYPVSRLVEVGYPVAFIAMVSAPPAVGVVLGAWSALRRKWLTPLFRSPRESFREEAFRHFISFASTMSVIGLVTVGVGLVVRSLIVRHSGLASAGVFSVAWTLSMTYIMLILSSFGTYYLPTLSQTVSTLDRTMLMQRVMRLVTLLVVPLITGVIVLKPLVVQILYSEEFTPALEIIRWMLIGDYFKVAAWVVAMPAIAYANMKVFFWTELLWNIGFLGLTALTLFEFDSMQGIGVSFLVVYMVYFAYYLYYACSRHQFPLTKGLVWPWLLGLVLLLGASWYAWSDVTVNWLVAPLWISAAISLSWFSLRRSEKEEVFHMVLRRNGVRP